MREANFNNSAIFILGTLSIIMTVLFFTGCPDEPAPVPPVVLPDTVNVNVVINDKLVAAESFITEKNGQLIDETLEFTVPPETTIVQLPPVKVPAPVPIADAFLAQGLNEAESMLYGLGYRINDDSDYSGGKGVDLADGITGFVAGWWNGDPGEYKITVTVEEEKQNTNEYTLYVDGEPILSVTLLPNREADRLVDFHARASLRKLSQIHIIGKNKDADDAEIDKLTIERIIPDP